MRWTQRLRIRQLHVLVELHRIRNLSRTAANLDMTQSALSKWLAELEDDLGVPLFEREPKGIRPTACCDELASHARKILAEVDRARATLEHIAQGASGHLAIGAAPAMIVDFVPTVVKQFHEHHPGAHITLSSGTLSQLMAGLREGRLDFAVARADQVSAYQGVACRVLFPDGLRVVVCPAHPLAVLPGVTWADTRPYAWVGPPQGSQLRRELDYELTLAQEPFPKVRIEVSDALANLRMLMDSALVGVMSDRVATVLSKLGHVVILPLAYKASSCVVLCTPEGSEPTPLGESFLACVVEQAGLRIQATLDGTYLDRPAALLSRLTVRPPGGRTP